MISIIICSVNKELCNQLKDNISETIGVAYEVIVIDNSNGKYGICEAYNLGAEKSNFEYLCFIHEDILFKTEEWGQKIDAHFKNSNIGLIGVAGGVAKTKFHSSWWYNLETSSTQRKNIIQKGNTNSIHEYENPFKEDTSRVLFVDGVFMACKKEIWKQYRFDEVRFPKFHFYDLDFSFSVNQHNQVAVVYDILVEHSSKGAYKKQWLMAAKSFTNKWKTYFPQYLTALSRNEKKEMEMQAARFFFEVCVQEKLLLQSIKTSFWFLLKFPGLKSLGFFTKRILTLLIK